MSQYIELAKLIDEHGISKVVGVLKEWESNKQENCNNCSGFGYIRQLYTEGEITNCKLCEGVILSEPYNDNENYEEYEEYTK